MFIIVKGNNNLLVTLVKSVSVKEMVEGEARS